MKKEHTNWISHVLLILTLFHGTLWVLNALNPLMGFLDNGITNVTLAAYLLLTGIQSVLCIGNQCRVEKKEVSNPKPEERP